MINKIAVCGAGTMGSGIAQLCAQNGLTVVLFDVNEVMLQKGKEGIQHNLIYLVNKQKITTGEKDSICQRIQYTSDVKECTADVLIEAIVENMEAKISLFNQLAKINKPDVIFATNTSSLSVSGIQREVPGPERVIGMHFFNPAPLMKLVEVVKGESTSEEVALIINTLCTAIGRVPVICKDAPGFIVNRVARHYYLEAMKLVEEGLASFENVDAIMEATGFKMGPFKLMDLIGMDINLSVTQSIYEAFNKAERFTPSPVQIEKVKTGELGRKTGRGFYTYPPSPE